MVSLLVSSQTESNHDTALTLACAGGHEELVSVLIARGANIEHRDKKGTQEEEFVHSGKGVKPLRYVVVGSLNLTQNINLWFVQVLPR